MFKRASAVFGAELQRRVGSVLTGREAEQLSTALAKLRAASST